MVDLSFVSTLAFSQGILWKLISTVIVLVLALVARLVAGRAIRVAIHSVGKRGPESARRVGTLSGIVNSILDVTIFGVTAVTLMSQWGVDIAPILTGAGILGLAVGFGAQTLVKDVVTGFFLLVENQFNTGDTVEAAGVKGEVLEVKLRTTTLKGSNGEVHIIPNSKIDTVTKYR